MNEMNRSLELGLKPEKRIFAPLSVFYLVAVLGVVLGGWQQSFADPVSGNTSAFPLDSRAVTTNGALSEREESASNLEPGDHTLKKSPLTLPGIQSAILTVSKEINTTAPIANLSARPGNAKSGNAKPAKASGKLSEKANPQLSTSDEAAVTKTSSGYYLDLPSPANRPEASLDASGPLALGDTDSGVQPATTVPLSSVPSRWLEGNAQQSSSQADASSVLDPEAQPLDLSSVPMLSGTATEALVRVTLGLLAVLGLLLGFSRGVLPRLMARYPAFFENLRRKGATTESSLPPASLSESANEFPADLYTELGGTVQSLFPAQAQLEGAPAASSFDFTSFDATRDFKAKNAAPSRTWRLSLGKPKKQAVSPTLEEASPFKVLFTSTLGENQALHLVEIGGRQLVLASTPYNISLIKDLGDAAPTQPDPDFAACNLAFSETLASTDLASNHIASNLAQGSGAEVELALLSLYPNAIPQPESPATPVEEGWNPEMLPGLDLTETAQSETVEAPSDESFLPLEFEFLNELQETEAESDVPAFMSPKSNAYATRPQRLIPLTEADRLYQQYLEILTPKTELEPEESVLPEPSLQSVVILNEYDDTYGY
jgi:hypothetical protein